MDNAAEFAKHKSIVSEVALNWALKNGHHDYDEFHEMLLKEDREVLPSFFVITLVKRNEDTLFPLAVFVDQALDFPETVGKYVEEVRKALETFYPGEKEIAKLFKIYDQLKGVAKRTLTEEQFEKIVGDHQFADMFGGFCR